jgi:large subunit ribosomal protein L25
MSQVFTFRASLRERAGKGAARATRRAGQVPAVVYGDKKAPVMIAVDPRELNTELRKGGFFARLFDIDIGSEKHRVLARDVQFHPVTDRPEHVDFLRVSADSTLSVNVPVHFVNQEKSIGIKKGGLLNIVQHTVELVVNANDIPEHLTIDLLNVDINGAVHISMLHIPAGAKVVGGERDFTIATIVPATGGGDA